MTPRPYEQRLRAESADETRRRILDAVYDQLREQPSAPASVDAIARRARVARSTVYLAFGSRAGLFDALAQDVLDRGNFQRVIEAIDQPDVRVSIEGGLRGSSRTYAAHRDVLRALFSMALLEEEAFGGAIHRMEQRRARGMRRLARRLHKQDDLQPGVSVKEAENVLWILTSFDAFDLLYTGHGLSADRTGDVLVGMAERNLYR